MMISYLASRIKALLPITILPQVKSASRIYDVEVKDIQGNSLDLAQYEGKLLLLVNTASKCGFTYQYEGLQELHEKFSEHLTIIGLPCNQFMEQEPGTEKEISSFCELQYGVRFPMTEKVDVKGENQHPVYQWLTQKSLNGVLDSEVEWNFQKYLIDGTGALRAVFYPPTKPSSQKFISTIEEVINEGK